MPLTWPSRGEHRNNPWDIFVRKFLAVSHEGDGTLKQSVVDEIRDGLAESGSAFDVANLITDTNATVTPKNTLTHSGILSGELWSFDCLLMTGCNNTGGIQFQVTSSGGGSIIEASISGVADSLTTFQSSRISAFNTLTTEAYNRYNGQTGYVRIAGSFIAGADGSVSIQFASAVDTQTSTIAVMSWYRARRIG